MSPFYSRIFDTLVSHIDPERAHHMALQALSLAQTLPGGLAPLRALAPPADPRLAVHLWGLSFANPLGVAAGLDKNAEALAALLALGFGHVETGTVTLRPQAGNPRPRMWRLPEHRAVINALGFPSDGADRVASRLSRAPDAAPGVIGINIGKNRDTPLDRAVDDYQALVACFAGRVDFITINISSPNTPGLRRLQVADELSRLLLRLQATSRELASARDQEPTPLLVKLSPDLDDGQLSEIAAVAVEQDIAGIVATNTTIERDGTTIERDGTTIERDGTTIERDRLPPEQRAMEGGLSGAPLKRRANQVARLLYRHLEGRLPIVGVGGIASAGDVIERMRNGAMLVQLYTGFVYGGPALPGQILRDLASEADRRGWETIGEIVGTAA